MAKSNIRWREADEKELARRVRNFNAKIDRLSKKPEMQGVIIPEKIGLKEARKRIVSRSDFNRELRAMEQFTKRGAEAPKSNNQGLSVTKWEYRQTKLKVNRINRYRDKKREEVANEEATLRGLGLGYTRKEMGSVRMNELKPKKFNFDNITRSDWKKYVEGVNIQAHPNYENERLELMRLNYVTALREQGYSDELIQIVDKMDLRLFEKTYYKEQLGDFEFVYDENLDLSFRETALMQIFK